MPLSPSPGAVHLRIRPSVAVLGFKNLSSRPDTAWISTALSEMLTADLAAGEQLRTVAEETVARTKIDLGLSDAESLSPEHFERKFTRTWQVTTSFSAPISTWEKKREAKFASTFASKTLSTEKPSLPSRKRAPRNTIIDLASQAGERLRQHFGLEKLSQLESDGVRAELPSNPEAMRPYAQGLASIRAFDALSAQDLLSRAVAADPGFPLAHAELARTWSSLGYDSNAQQEAKKALERSEQSFTGEALAGRGPVL